MRTNVSVIGHYRITRQLGTGGMGEVYEAEDLRLGRKVALKLLPEEMAANPQTLSRFEREARALAALNHPNIVTIYSVEQAAGHNFITMELVQGRSLSGLIPRTGFELNKLFDLSIPLTDALAAAHERGIGHRDLKPGNIMINDRGEIKVIDFGIAKLLADERSKSGTDSLTVLQTQEGKILGTPAYMSPEQIEGGPVDHRTDIFSLGIILCEMASGERPFKGENPATIMFAILRDPPPPLTELKPGLPEHFGRIIKLCLQKEPNERYQTALDVRNELKALKQETAEISRTQTVRIGATPKHRISPAVWAGVALLAVILIAVAAIYSPNRKGGMAAAQSNSPSRSVTPLLMRLEPSQQLTHDSGLEEWASWAPDGNRILYTAEVNGLRALFTRTMQTGQTTPVLQEDRDLAMPVWNPAAPDEIVFVRHSEPLGKLAPSDVYYGYFLSGGNLWHRNLATGTEALIAEGAYNPSFATNGLLAFHRMDRTARIWTSDSQGRRMEVQTRDDSEEVYHLEPSFSPTGRMIVFRREEKNRSSLWVIDLKTREQFRLTPDGLYMQPAWSSSGRYIYFSSYLGKSGLNLWRVEVDSNGRAKDEPEPVTSGQGGDVHPAISPDGRRLIFAILHMNSDIWRLPVDKVSGASNGPPELIVSTTREDSRAAWSPDEKYIAFNSDRAGGQMNLWTHRFSDRSEQQVTRGPGGDYQPDWSPDGRTLIFFSLRSGNSDIWSVEVENGMTVSEPRQLTTSAAMDVNPFFSEDGKQIAFMSDREGRNEIFVMNRDGTGQRRVSTGGTGGHFLRWLKGKPVYLSSANGLAMLAQANLNGQQEALQSMEGTHVGGHISLSPTGSHFIELAGHETIMAFKLGDINGQPVFRFPDLDARIDYPVWSPTGNWVLFDGTHSEGSDLYLVEGLE